MKHAQKTFTSSTRNRVEKKKESKLQSFLRYTQMQKMIPKTCLT